MKNQWLDNYGEEANYNDSKVTLPEGYVGYGYDTKGRNYSPAWGGQFQMGGSIPGAVGFAYARTDGAAPANGKYAKKTTPSAQNGKKLDYSEMPYNLKEIKQFYNTMFDSDWYKQRLAKNQYPNPDKVVNTRKAYTNKTKFTEYEYPDSELDKLKNIFTGKDDLTGSKHSKKDNRISFVKSQADEQFTFPRTIIGHEFSHPGDVAYPLNKFEHDALFNRLNLDGDVVIDEHDRQPTENKADINAFRYDLYKSGNFDPKTGKYKTKSGKFDESMIQKIKDVGGFDRLKTNYKPEDLIYLFNTIADNSQPEITPIAKEGKVIKDDNGYWNPDNWGKVVEIDSNNITMQGVDQPLLGISDEGDIQYMEPGEDYKFKGKKVREYPVAQNGKNQSKYGNIGTPEEQKQWLLNYIQSPMYRERLGIEMKRQSPEEVDKMIKQRYNNVNNVNIFYPKKPIGSDYGYVSGVSILNEKDKRSKYVDEYGNVSDFKNDIEPKFPKKGVYLEREYNTNSSFPISSGFETIPIHELGHQLDSNGKLIPTNTLINIANRTNSNLSINQIKNARKNNEYVIDDTIVSDLYNMYPEIVKGKGDMRSPVVFDYVTNPTEFTNRLIPIRMLLDKQGIQKVGKEKFTPQMYDKMMQNDTIKNNTHFDDVIKKIKGNNDTEKKRNFIHLMNTIADNSDSELIPVAKNGINNLDENSLQKLDQLTNFTNYNTKQPGGWLQKYK